MPVTTWLRRLRGPKSGVVVGEEVVTPVAPADAVPVDLPPPAATEPAPELPQAVDLETPPLRAVEPPSVSEETAASSPAPIFGASMAYGWITDVGRVRDQDEDAVFVFVAEQCSSMAMPPFGLFILADGMGGHHAGEVASAVACQTVAAQIMEHVYLPLLYGDGDVLKEGDGSVPSLTETLAEAVQFANQEVFASTPGSGTTLTCALVVGNQLVIGHVGDSRAYLRDGGGVVRLLTNDHSMVKQLVDIGQLTPEAAAVHPRRNILYRAVGQGGGLTVDVRALTLDGDAQLLLCTDGLWGLVPEAELWQIVTAASSVQGACEQLVAAANAAGGTDNITAIVVELRHRVAPEPGSAADESDHLA